MIASGDPLSGLPVQTRKPKAGALKPAGSQQSPSDNSLKPFNSIEHSSPSGPADDSLNSEKGSVPEDTLLHTAVRKPMSVKQGSGQLVSQHEGHDTTSDDDGGSSHAAGSSLQQIQPREEGVHSGAYRPEGVPSVAVVASSLRVQFQAVAGTPCMA